jgi:hypothetical protein
MLIAPALALAEIVAGVATGSDIDDFQPADEPMVLPDQGRAIDFDDWPAPNYFIHAMPLRHEYWPAGVDFAGPGPLDGGAILNEASSFGVTGHSPPNFLAFNCEACLCNGGVPQCPEEIIFLVPTESVAALVGSGYAVGQALTMTAYSDNGELLDSDTVVLSATMTEIVVESLSHAASIARVVISGSGCWVLDDLVYGARVVADETSSWSDVKNLYR